MKSTFALIFFLALSALGYLSSFIVHENQQALIFWFKAEPRTVKHAGLHFLVPFIETAVLYEKRILHWEDPQPTNITTSDQQFIHADTTARWRIVDPKKFYATAGDIKNATNLLNGDIAGAVRDVISKHRLIEVIRDTNNIFKDLKKLRAVDISSEEGDMVRRSLEGIEVQKISVGRSKISELITESAHLKVKKLGIELVDVQLRAIRFRKEGNQDPEQKIFERMIQDQKKIAVTIRAEGQSKHTRQRGLVQKELKTIQSEAYRKSQILRGTADAQAIEIFSNAVGQDPEFFKFVKTLETYEKTIAKRGEFILSTDSEFLSVLSKGG